MSNITVALGEVAAINPGLPSSMVLAREDRVSFLPMASVDADTGTVDDSEAREFTEVSKGYTPFISGDLLVAKITPCFENGKIAQALLRRNIGFGSTEFHVIRPSAAVHPRYLLHHLRQPWVRVAGARRMTGSAGQRRVPEHFLAHLQIFVPPLVDQRRIAAILDKADDLRAKRRAALAQLDALPRSILAEVSEAEAATGDPWPVRKLGDVAEIMTGFAFKSQEYVTTGESIRLCRGANVLPGRFDWTDLACWPKSRAPEVQAFMIEPDDILMALDRPWISEGFKIVQACQEDCPLLLVQRVARVRANDGATSGYLYAQLSGARFQRHCRPTETTVPHISPNEVRSFELPWPPEAVRREFADKLAGAKRLLESARTSLRNLDVLFASLQHRAFRGEL